MWIESIKQQKTHHTNTKPLHGSLATANRFTFLMRSVFRNAILNEFTRCALFECILHVHKYTWAWYNATKIIDSDWTFSNREILGFGSQLSPYFELLCVIAPTNFIFLQFSNF